MNALYIICGLGVASLLAEVANVRKGLVTLLTLGIAVSIVFAAMEWNSFAGYYNSMLLFDNLAVAFTILILTSAAIWFWMARSYFHDETHVTDRASLVLFVVAGAIMLASFDNMAILFLGIEILSISLYVLAGSKKMNLFSNEAAFKYFLMGSFATGFLLMGIALIYGATGYFSISAIAEFSSANQGNLPGFFQAGILMILVGMAFKVSAVPFHFWAPDVYEGSPTPITAFMSTVVKIAAFSAFIKLFTVCFDSARDAWVLSVEVITVLTLVFANVTAVYQSNVKRMLAYSSVGHAGYALLALSSNGNSGGVILYYLAAYATASLLAFSILIAHENHGGDLSTKSFNGFFKRNPFEGTALIISLLSLAGIPPLAGFFGKYLVFSLALNSGYTGLVVLAVITSLIGVYYYFRVIVAMFSDSSDERTMMVSVSDRVLIFLLMAITIGLGVWPDLINAL